MTSFASKKPEFPDSDSTPIFETNGRDTVHNGNTFSETEESFIRLRTNSTVNEIANSTFLNVADWYEFNEVNIAFIGQSKEKEPLDDSILTMRRELLDLFYNYFFAPAIMILESQHTDAVDIAQNHCNDMIRYLSELIHSKKYEYYLPSCILQIIFLKTRLSKWENPFVIEKLQTVIKQELGIPSQKKIKLL